MIAVIISILVLLFVYQFINLRYLMPKKNVVTIPIKNVLIGLPTIDRDSDVAPLIYKGLKEAMEELPNINFSLLSIMRNQDTESYNFWKDKSNIIKLDDYDIMKRHNFDKMASIFNRIKDNSIDHDALIILESDILVNKDTIKKLISSLSFSHVALFPFETPWAKYPVIMKNSMFYDLENARNLKEDQFILGHGTGCMILNKQVISDKNIEFSNKTIFGIEGQDIGFFDSLNKNHYKTWLINEELEHLYKK